MIFEKGDKYIHFTKHGGVNRGVVRYAGYTIVIDTKNGVSYKRDYILNTNGVSYDLDGSDGRFYLIEKEYTKEECENIANNFKKFGEAKKQRTNEILAKMKDKGHIGDIEQIL